MVLPLRTSLTHWMVPPDSVAGVEAVSPPVVARDCKAVPWPRDTHISAWREFAAMGSRIMSPALAQECVLPPTATRAMNSPTPLQSRYRSNNSSARSQMPAPDQRNICASESSELLPAAATAPTSLGVQLPGGGGVTGVVTLAVVE